MAWFSASWDIGQVASHHFIFSLPQHEYAKLMDIRKRVHDIPMTGEDFIRIAVVQNWSNDEVEDDYFYPEYLLLF